MRDERRFYVYVIFRPNGVPCYVGKGQGGRWKDHVQNSHNRHLSRIYTKSGGNLPILKVREGLLEEEAFLIEKAFISALGRSVDGGVLVNRTNGGDGSTGLIVSAELRASIGAASKQRWADPEARGKMIAAQNAGKSTEEFRANRSAASREAWSDADRRKRLSETKKAILSSPDARRQISERTRAAMARPEVSQKVSEAQKKRFSDPAEVEKLRLANVGRKHSPETIAKRAASLTGQKRSAESRAKMSAWQVGRKMSDEARAKMSIAAKLRCAKAKVS